MPRYFSTADERLWEHERGRGRRVTGERTMVGYTATDDPERARCIREIEQRSMQRRPASVGPAAARDGASGSAQARPSTSPTIRTTYSRDEAGRATGLPTGGNREQFRNSDKGQAEAAKSFEVPGGHNDGARRRSLGQIPASSNLPCLTIPTELL